MLAETTTVQTATVDFFGPTAAAYTAICGCWVLVNRSAGARWQAEEEVRTMRPWLDLLGTLLVAAGTFGLGAAYREGCLLPMPEGLVGDLTAATNLCIPYLPIFLWLALRRQSLPTVWISWRAMPWKLATGMLAAVVGLFVFLALRGELSRFEEVALALSRRRSWLHAPAVFLEAVAVAFVFVRLRWLTSTSVAILLPSLLFAAGHVPSGVASGRSPAELAAFFIFNVGLCAMIFAIVAKSRDVIWIAIPHFMLDIAMGLFD